MTIRTIVAAVAIAFALPANAGSGTTLDFEEFNPTVEWGYFQQFERPLVTKGFVLETPEPMPFAFASIDRSWKFNRRSTAMNSTSCLGLIVLTEGSNNPFRLVSIDIAELNGSGQPAVVTFIAKLANGRGALHQVITDGRRGWQRFAFPAKFAGVLSVSWRQSDCSTGNAVHMFDNIRIER